MTRRMAQSGGLRRSSRDGFVRPRTFIQMLQAILGAVLVEVWDAQLGIALGAPGEVDTWTGQIRGIVLQAPGAGNRMLYAADGVLFGSKLLVKSVAAVPRYLKNTAISPALFLNGSRPYVGIYGRHRTLLGTAAYTSINDAADTRAMFAMHDSSNARAWDYSAQDIAVAIGAPLAVEFFEEYFSPTGVWTCAINGSTVGTVGAGTSLVLDRTRLSIGANLGGVLGADASFATIVMCSAYPGAGPAAAARALIAARYA